MAVVLILVTAVAVAVVSVDFLSGEVILVALLAGGSGCAVSVTC